MNIVKKLFVGLVVLALSVPAFAISQRDAEVFDKWLPGMYTDQSTAGPFYILRVGSKAYQFQGRQMVELDIDSVEVVSSFQVRFVLINQFGGALVWDRYGSAMDIYTPNGQTIPTRKVRGLTSVERAEVAGIIAKLEAKNSAIQASFDCAKASTDVEKLICSSELLAEMDVVLAQRYKSLMLLLDDDDKAFNRTEQREWLKGRDGYSAEAGLADYYIERIEDLDTIINYLNKPAEFR